MIRAAGILILNEHGQALFLKRGPGGDMPGLWAFPGGRLEDGESTIEAAIRETEEEAGVKIPEKSLRPWTRAVSARETTGAAPTPAPGAPAATPVAIAQAPGAAVLAGEGVDFTTYLVKREGFEPVLGPVEGPEHVAYAWAPVDAPPEPLHPGCRVALAMFAMDELGIARAMMAGELTSPQHYKNVALFDIRITGTGVAFRNEKKDDKGKVVRAAEWVYRRPENYLTDEFVQRCNGLTVIMKHPEKAILNSKEFGMRAVGSVMLPYVKGDEVWGIAKVYDSDAVEILETTQMSTSPGVLLSGHDDQRITMEDGSPLLIEGKPALLDHIAICERGVWDKGGEPDGVNSIAIGDSDMTPEEIKAKADAAATGEKLDKLLASLDSLSSRLDAVEEEKKADKARKDAEEAEQKAVEDKARKDAEEEEKKADKARKDAEESEGFKKKFDRKDGESNEDYGKRCDAEEEGIKGELEKKGESKEVAADKAKKARKDAEEEMADKDEAEEAKKKADAAATLSGTTAETVLIMQKKIAELTALVPRAVTDQDYTALLEAQARADSVYSQHGLQAPRALNGETVPAYRKRLARGLQAHSERWKTTDLLKLDDAAFGVVEEQIYADSVAMALHPADLADGTLRPFVRKLESGHTVTEFRGSPGAWMNKFAGPVRQSVKKFLTGPSA